LKDFTPRPYQTLALDWMRERRRFNLFAGMGLGKTVTTLTWLLANGIDLTDQSLVIAPLRVARKVWPGEQGEWSHLQHLKVVPIVGDAKQRARALRQDAEVHTINYDNLPWLVKELDGAWPFATVVPDESTRLKGFRTQQGAARAGALRHVAHHRVKNWINLTGLPAPNGLRDLWGPQWFVDGGASLGLSFDAFEQRWFYTKPNRQGYSQIFPHVFAQAQIEAAIKPTTLAIDAKDWFDLREPITTDVWVDLPAKAHEHFNTMSKRFFMDVKEGRIMAATAGVKSLKLMQLANGAVYYDTGEWTWVHDEKIDALESIVEEANGAPVLLAYQWKSDLARLVEAFPTARVVTSKDMTFEDDWNAGRVRLALVHPKSAGHGNNWQVGGNILVYFGQDWNLEDYAQILERIGPTRQMQAGLDRPVFVYHIMARGTLDAHVRYGREHKLTPIQSIMRAMSDLI
jgi:SNF2 family DNA or RNA helicase